MYSVRFKQLMAHTALLQLYLVLQDTFNNLQKIVKVKIKDCEKL